MPLSISAISRLQHQHKTIHDLVKGLSEEQLNKRVNPEKWSAFEQIAHLAAYQPTFFGRLHKMQQEVSPSFERYVADNDPLFHECCKNSLKELLEDLDTQRFIIINHLTTLPEQALRRTGHHPKFGLLTIVEWTEFFLLHEAHHLFSIFMLTREQLILSQPTQN
jgi:hypothetical protein